MVELEDELVTAEHEHLISAISKLDKTQHIVEPTRNEPTNLHSEFNLIKGANKLNINNVAKVLEDTAHHVQISKKLRKSQDLSKVLPKPLEKPQAERIKRSTGYEETKIKVGRWDPVVARSRTVDFVSFPLKRAVNKLQPTQEFLTKFKLKSELEKELDDIDPPHVDKAESDEERVYPMSYQEMLEHRQQTAKFRAQQSYKAAKAKRQSKIKSKKYHRILKKERMKQQLKEFEELQKINPEEALKKLEALEKARALERHTLRHKNTGKWAKSKLVRAKYDKDVRQQLAEQLAVSKGLTKKIVNNESSDSDVNDNEITPDVMLSQDPMNPWVLKRSDKSNTNAEFDFGYKKYLKDKMYKHPEISSDSESEPENSVLDSIKNNIENLKDADISLEPLATEKSKRNKADIKQGKTHSKSESESCVKNNVSGLKDEDIIIETLAAKKPKKGKIQTNRNDNKIVATSEWIVETVDDDIKVMNTKSSDLGTMFDSLESSVAVKVDNKLKKLRKNISNLEKATKNTKLKGKIVKEMDNLEYLKLKNQRKKAVIDEELIETASREIEDNLTNNKNVLSNAFNNSISVPTENNGTSDIDPSRFIKAKPKYLNSILPDDTNEIDQLDDEEQVLSKINIEEVFEEDDVVASFRQEKEDEINKDKPRDIDLSLPGWGTWGGKGVKAPKRKRNRFILKAPPKVPRRDENKGDIIIKEYKDPKLSVHKVTDVPFPFSSVKEYEASIRTPLGNTFIPERAHQKLIKPSIITKAGTIIDPMDEDELLVKKNLIFKNESLIKVSHK